MIPVVSVIIPTYNRANLLPHTLDSVLGQTFDAFEIIVVDDGSTDDTRHVMERYNDPRIQYICNSWTGHPSPNRNTGIKLSKGDYLAFVDSDDLWLPQKLEHQVGYMKAHPDMQWCFCHYDNYYGDTGRIEHRPIPVSLVNGTYSPVDLLCGNFIGSPTVLARKGLFDMAGGFDETDSIRFVEDWELWLRFSAIQPGGFIAEPLAQYRLHSSAATSQPDPYEAATRCLAAISTAVENNPETYSPHYHQAVNAILPVMVKRLLVLGEREKARNLCKQASLHPIKAWKLAGTYALGLLPSSALDILLKANRIIKTALGND